MTTLVIAMRMLGALLFVGGSLPVLFFLTNAIADLVAALVWMVFSLLALAVVVVGSLVVIGAVEIPTILAGVHRMWPARKTPTPAPAATPAPPPVVPPAPAPVSPSPATSATPYDMLPLDPTDRPGRFI